MLRGKHGKLPLYIGLAVVLLIIIGVLLFLILRRDSSGDYGAAYDLAGREYQPQETPDPAISENVGLSSSNVRLFIENNTDLQWRYPNYRAFNMHEIYQYHEFVYSDNDMRFIFTTEFPVYEFQILDVAMNDLFWREDALEGERAYNIVSILYSISELTPEIPFVFAGPNLGGTFASQGFSFIDVQGIAWYFTFQLCGRDGILVVYHF